MRRLATQRIESYCNAGELQCSELKRSGRERLGRGNELECVELRSNGTEWHGMEQN
jgi:hypothetical protein